MKRSKKISFWKTTSIAACLVALIIFSQTAFAQEMFAKIVKTFSTGENQFVQTDYSAGASVPDVLKGKLFDKDGKQVYTFEKGKAVYTKDGDAVLGIDYTQKNEPKIITDKNADPIAQGSTDMCLIVKDENAINDHLNFKVKTPSYLPDGYLFYGAEIVADSKDQVTLYYNNEKTGEKISINERYNFKYKVSTDGEMIETKINGHKAVLSNNHDVFWENGKISYSASIEDGLTKDDLVKVAESIK